MLLLAAAAPAQAVSIGLTPATQSVAPGSGVDVAVTISGLGDPAGSPPGLGVFDLDLGFDPALLGLTGVDYGDPSLGDQLDLFGLGSLSLTTPGPGVVNLFELSFDLATDVHALQADQFTLAVLHFSALADGTSALHLTLNALGDADGNALLATARDGSIAIQSVETVPEPASLLLIATGLAAITAARRRTGVTPQ